MTSLSPQHLAAVKTVEAINLEFSRGRLRAPGRLREKLHSVVEAATMLDELPNSPKRLEHAAMAYQLAGELYLALGRLDDGVDCLSKAEERFEEAGCDNEDYARFLHDFAVTLHQLGVPNLPLQYARRARDMIIRNKLGGVGGRYRRMDEFVRGLEAEGNLSAQEHLDAARKRLRDAKRGHRADAAQALAVCLLDTGVGPQHVQELHDALHIAFGECWRQRKRRLDDAVQVLRTLMELYWQRLPLPGWAVQAAEDVVESAHQAQRLDQVSDAMAVLGICRVANGERARGLDDLLKAITTHDEFSMLTESSTMRMIAARPNEYARQFALHIAIENKDTALVAELIESARLQVEPAYVEASQNRERSRSLVTGLRPISVHGQSRLARFYTNGDLGPPLELEDAIRAVGGTNAVWWGCWAVNERNYWVLRLDGEWTVGEVDLSEGSTLGGLFIESSEALPFSTSVPVRAILAGPWCRSAFAEEAIAADLGEALIPDRLKQRIRELSAASHPISLVISGNLLAFVPAALLGVRIDVLTTRRLVEAAVIRMAPPTILTDRLVRTNQPQALKHPLLVACLDPRGDLENSRETPAGARMILSGDPKADYPRPTLLGLTAALARYPPSCPGLFYYSGHTIPLGQGGDAEDALALHGGDVLSASALFAGVSRDYGPRFPARVLLSACGSSGAQGAGSGEWLGLTAAVLWAGASQVIATTWPIWDTEFTSLFDRELAEALQQPVDPAVALRAAQLVALELWRGSVHDFEQEMRLSSMDRLQFPLIFAAFVCIGLHYDS